jgi:hypothetical protein
MIDGDSFADPQLVARHAEHHRSLPNTALIGRRIEADWASLKALAEGRCMGVTHPHEEDPRHWHGIGAVTSSGGRTPWLFAYTHNLSIPRQDLLAVGGFDESLANWGFEDNELAYRVFRLHGRRDGYFHYEPNAVVYHLPHFRDRDRMWKEAFANGRTIRNKHPHFDMELLGTPPWEVTTAVSYYDQCLDALRAAWTREMAVQLSSAVGVGDSSEAWIGLHLEHLRKLGVTTMDHGIEATSTNFHLLGITMPFEENRFSRLVVLDVWRMLRPADLSSLVLEGLRIAGEVVLVASSGIAALIPEGVGFVEDLDYVAGMLSVECSAVITRSPNCGMVRCLPPS